MNCVILQPSYIPWRGYFHQIQKADTFVFYDDVQYDKHGWRNRNKVKAPQGTLWLTIPVLTKGARERGETLRETRINWANDWTRKHRMTLRTLYARAPWLERYWPEVENIYAHHDERLADLSIRSTVAIARLLGITKTRFVRSSQLGAIGTKTDRLLDILRKVGATHYISGPAARDYLDEQRLADARITLEYMTYNYPEYPQLYPPFAGDVSILDLLFMTGSDAPSYVWSNDGPSPLVVSRST